MRISAFAVAAFALGAFAPARAQVSDRAFQDQLGQAKAGVKTGAAAAAAEAKSRQDREDSLFLGKLTDVLLAMDGQGADSVGHDTVQLFKGLNGKFRFTFADGATKFKVDWNAMMQTGTADAVFSRSLSSGSKRYLSVFLAEAAPTLIRQPKTAEEEYMVLSRMTRVWLELGGNAAKLPDFDGTVDQETAARLKQWLEYKDMPSFAKAVALPSLSAQLKSNRSSQSDLRKLIAKWEADDVSEDRVLGLRNTLTNLGTDENTLAAALGQYRGFRIDEDAWVGRLPEAKAAALGCHAAKVFPQSYEAFGSDCQE